MSLGVWLTLVEGWCAVDVSWDERGLRLFSYCVIPHSSDSTLLDEQTAMKHWSLSLGGKNCMLHLFLMCTVTPKSIRMLLDTSVVLIWSNDIHTFITKYQGKWHLQTNDSFSQNQLHFSEPFQSLSSNSFLSLNHTFTVLLNIYPAC